MRKIAALADTWPGENANVIRLQGRTEYRLRVQDWRVIFHIEDDTLVVDDIGPRGAIYEDRS